MNWRVVVKGDSPSGDSIVALCNLTGLNMAEVQLSLTKGELVAGDGMSESRARDLALSITKNSSLQCRIEQSETPGSAPAMFRVVLTGYRPGSRARLRKAIQKMSGLPYEQVVVWFSRIPFVLLDSTGHSTAMVIRRTISEAGGVVDVQPEGARSITISGRPEASSQPAAPDVKVTGKSEKELQATVDDEVSTGGGKTDSDDSIPERESETWPIPPVIGEHGYIDDFEGVVIPPAVRFTQPGMTPGIPPIAGRPTASEEDPHEFDFDEPAAYRAVPPPLPHNSIKLFLCDPSEDDLDRVALALERVCEFDRKLSASLLEECPSWIASFTDPQRASELAIDLEEQGATLTLAWNMPGRFRDGEKKSSKPLLKWLSVE